MRRLAPSAVRMVSSIRLGAVPRDRASSSDRSGRALLGNDEVHDVGADQFDFLPAQQVRPGRIDRAQRAVEACHHHDVGRQRPHAVAVGGALGNALLQSLVQQAQRIDCHAPLVDVTQDGGDEGPAFARPPRCRRLEMAGRAVLASRRELDGAAQPSPSRTALKAAIHSSGLARKDDNGWPISSSGE